MPLKAPEPLLTRAQLEALTGFSRNKLLAMLADPEVWNVPGGTKLISGEYRLPISFYNRWLESRDLAAPAGKGAGN